MNNPRNPPRSSEQGSVTVALAAVLLVVGVVFVGSQLVTGAARERAVAQAGADALALAAGAAAPGDISTVSALASYNGVSIVEINHDRHNEVEVTVRYGLAGVGNGSGSVRALATARAVRSRSDAKLVTIEVWVPLSG